VLFWGVILGLYFRVALAPWDTFTLHTLLEMLDDSITWPVTWNIPFNVNVENICIDIYRAIGPVYTYVQTTF
jgi:hypothetical protein